MAKKKKVRLQDIANSTGYSIATISHFINKTRNIEDSTQKTIVKAMEELGYQLPTPRIYKQKDITIGLIISDIQVDYFAEIIKYTEEFVSKNGYNLLIMDSEENPQKEKSSIEYMMNKGVAGIILAPANTKSDLSFCKHFPIIQIDRKLDQDFFDFVGIDNFTTTYMMTKKLGNKSLDSIGFITFPVDNYTARERLKGYKLATIENNQYQEDHILTISYDTEEDSKDIATFLQENPSIHALICTSTNICNAALTAIKTLEHAAISKICTFDDNKWLNHLAMPIDSVKQPTQAIAISACELLLNRILTQETMNEPKKVYLNSKIIERNTEYLR